MKEHFLSRDNILCHEVPKHEIKMGKIEKNWQPAKFYCSEIKLIYSILINAVSTFIISIIHVFKGSGSGKGGDFLDLRLNILVADIVKRGVSLVNKKETHCSIITANMLYSH